MIFAQYTKSFTIQTLKIIAVWQAENYVNKMEEKVKLLLYERK